MKGNNREIQRQKIEDRIIDRIDRAKAGKSTPPSVKLVTMFDFIKHRQPAEAWILGKMAGIV